jgi:hypothetical protein
MDVKAALKGQYHAALATLKQAIEPCPAELWVCDDVPAPFWQVAYHTLFFTNFYLMASREAFLQGGGWPGGRMYLEDLGHRQAGDEPPYSQAEMLAYWQFCDDLVDPAVEQCDLDAAECGFPWYPLPKLDHQLVNIRHIQHHAAVLASRLKHAGGPSVGWVGSA